MNCTNAMKLRNTGKYLFKTRCKWENKVRGAQPPLEVTRE
jgi:hypothetical protein